jgi:hypothetical protein
VANCFLALKSLAQAIKTKKGEHMHLICLTMLAFLYVNALSTGSDPASTPRWITIQTFFAAPKTHIPTREPFLAAETEDRAPTRRDGLAGHETQTAPTRAFAHPPKTRWLPDSSVWKPWLWGS